MECVDCDFKGRPSRDAVFCLSRPACVAPQGQVTRAQEAEENYVIKRELAVVRQQCSTASESLEKAQDTIRELQQQKVKQQQQPTAAAGKLGFFFFLFFQQQRRNVYYACGMIFLFSQLDFNLRHPMTALPGDGAGRREGLITRSRL